MSARNDPAAHCDAVVRLRMLGRARLFAGLDQDALGRVNAACRSVAIGAGALVFGAGDEAERIHVVATGSVKLLRHGADGSVSLVDLCLPGDDFGGLRVLGDERYEVDAVVAQPACLLVLEAATVERILVELPLVARNALAITAQRLRDARGSVHALATRPVIAKVAGALVRLAQRLGPDDTIALTQAELAAMCGAAPESANRALRSLRGDGLVAVERGRLRVLDAARLAGIAESTARR